MAVVNDLSADKDWTAESHQRALDDLYRALYAGTKTAGLCKQ